MAVAARVRTARNVADRGVARSRRAPAAARRTTARRSVARLRFSRTLTALSCALALAFAFLYVGVYGTLATTSHNLNQLQKALRREEILNERLRIELERKLSPQGVVEAAQAKGMIYATEYDYLRDTRNVASAPTNR